MVGWLLCRIYQLLDGKSTSGMVISPGITSLLMRQPKECFLPEIDSSLVRNSQWNGHFASNYQNLTYYESTGGIDIPPGINSSRGEGPTADEYRVYS
jgi:hypothetical protein